MAKKKTSRKKKKSSGSSLTKTIKSMATKRKKAVRKAHRKPAKRGKAKRTVRRSLGDNSKKLTKGWGDAALQTGAGMLGGGIYAAPQLMFQMPWWAKLIAGVSIATTANKFGHKSVGGGVAGAMTYDLMKSNPIMPLPLKDEGELEDEEWVDADTLSDSGFVLQDGTPVVIDDNGNMYALNEAEELVEIGDDYDLQDVYDLQDDMQNTALVPLADRAYAE